VAVGRLLLSLLLAAVEPVGLQRVVQRRTAVAGTRRRQRLGLLVGRPLLRPRRYGRPRGTEVGAVGLGALELARGRGVLPARQGVLPGGAAVVTRHRELAGRAAVVGLRGRV